MFIIKIIKILLSKFQGPRGAQGPRGLGLEPPRLIKSTLNDRYVNLTDSATFECTFSGNPIPEITWKSLVKNSKVSTIKDPENSQISSRLIATNISWNDQGPLECRAMSLLGETSVLGNLNTLCKYD